MELGLKGKTAFVSGSSAGIGFAIAIALAQEGVEVIINAEKQELIDKALDSQKYEMKGIAADLSTAEGALLIAKQVPEVDILINNVGVFEPKSFVDLTDNDWFKIFELNVMSGIRLTRSYLPGMLGRDWGRIIFISSESGVMIPREMVHYGVSKTAQIAVARGAAEWTAGTEVTVNSVLVGPTRTPAIDHFIADLAREWRMSPTEVEKQYFEKVRGGSLLNRFEEPEEVAKLVVFLCSPLAIGINGSAIRVEGGLIKSII